VQPAEFGTIKIMIEKNKVVGYVVKEGKLLVFRHVDFSYEEVGIQVPAGTVKTGENTEHAPLRQLQEETGYSGFKIIKFLGTQNYNCMPEKAEIHIRYFFQAEAIENLPERWVSQEDHDGVQAPTRFECFWIPLERGHILQSGQGALLSEVQYKF
jgi:ADP-ribose pyrophosphatase YjhB (NUDIX family)